MKKVILGLVFVFGMTSISDAKTKLATTIIEVDCYFAYTVCDNNVSYLAKGGNLSYELEFQIFDDCMTGNGC